MKKYSLFILFTVMYLFVPSSLFAENEKITPEKMIEIAGIDPEEIDIDKLDGYIYGNDLKETDISRLPVGKVRDMINKSQKRIEGNYSYMYWTKSNSVMKDPIIIRISAYSISEMSIFSVFVDIENMKVYEKSGENVISDLKKADIISDLDPQKLSLIRDLYNKIDWNDTAVEYKGEMVSGGLRYGIAIETDQGINRCVINGYRNILSPSLKNLYDEVISLLDYEDEVDL